MATLFVKHTVGDYKKWRKGFDEFQSQGAQLGIRSAAVFQSAGNPNEVTVMHNFDSVAAAQTFTQAEALKSAMDKAGVQGAPMIWITEKA